MSDLPKKVFTNPIHFLAFGFGAGLSPKAPGTVGTLVAIPIYILLVHTNWWIYSAVVVVSFGFGIWLCGKSSEALGVHDHGGTGWMKWWVT